MGYKVKIGLSNKHVHLNERDRDILFGKDYELTPVKPLVQPGQFAADEKVDIVGPKTTLKGVRVLGPLRPETQMNSPFLISMSIFSSILVLSIVFDILLIFIMGYLLAGKTFFTVADQDPRE